MCFISVIDELSLMIERKERKHSRLVPRAMTAKRLSRRPVRRWPSIREYNYLPPSVPKCTFFLEVTLFTCVCLWCLVGRSENTLRVVLRSKPAKRLTLGLERRWPPIQEYIPLLLSQNAYFLEVTFWYVFVNDFFITRSENALRFVPRSKPAKRLMRGSGQRWPSIRELISKFIFGYTNTCFLFGHWWVYFMKFDRKERQPLRGSCSNRCWQQNTLRRDQSEGDHRSKNLSPSFYPKMQSFLKLPDWYGLVYVYFFCFVFCFCVFYCFFSQEEWKNSKIDDSKTLRAGTRGKVTINTRIPLSLSIINWTFVLKLPCWYMFVYK